jgi:hypothetical protein
MTPLRGNVKRTGLPGQAQTSASLSSGVLGSPSSCDTKRRLKLQARDRVEAVLRARASGR